MHRDHPGRDFFVGAMVGSALGALTAAMFSTKKGHKVQKELINKYHEFEDVVRNYAHKKQKTVKRAVKQLAKQAKKRLAKARRRY